MAAEWFVANRETTSAPVPSAGCQARMGGGIGRTSLDGLTRSVDATTVEGTDGRQLGLKVLYMCVDGRDLALGPRSYDCQIALGSRGRFFGLGSPVGHRDTASQDRSAGSRVGKSKPPPLVTERILSGSAIGQTSC